MSNETRKELETQIQHYEELRANPQRYNLDINAVRKIEGILTDLYEQYKVLPLEELPSYKIRLYTQPLTMRTKDTEVELVYKNGKWKISKFVTNNKAGKYGVPELIYNAEGKPIQLKYTFVNSETTRTVTVLHEISIDEKEVLPEPREPSKPIEIPMWKCPRCSHENFDELLLCQKCRYPKNEEAAKDFGVMSLEGTGLQQYAEPKKEPEKKKKTNLDKLKGLLK